MAIGFPLGKLKVRGTSLGVAMVLRAGLAIGATDEALRLPQITCQLGLVLFVSTIGIANGRGFVASFRRKGPRDSAVVVAIVGFAAILTGALASLLDLAPAMAAGVFAGSLTNTPALAAAEQ